MGYFYYTYYVKQKNHQTTEIDYSKMTEEEFLEFLDAEAARIRKENYIRPLTNMHVRYAKYNHESKCVVYEK